MLRRTTMLPLLGLIMLALGADEPKSTVADKAALAALQSYVGEWRGVGQPKRGSSDGAWVEEFQWAWHFEDTRAELVATSKQGKYYERFQLQPGEKANTFVLLAKKADADAPDRFTGALDADKQLVLTAAAPRDDQPARISIRQVAGGDRLLMLYEKRVGEDRYARLAEVGSTRKGSSFGKGGDGSPECVVTGGHGSIKVEYQGKTYYVCCTGCRDEFLEHPETILAEYRERKAKKAAEK
jgi:YHS domain-containing protein